MPENRQQNSFRSFLKWGITIIVLLIIGLAIKYRMDHPNSNQPTTTGESPSLNQGSANALPKPIYEKAQLNGKEVYRASAVTQASHGDYQHIPGVPACRDKQQDLDAVGKIATDLFNGALSSDPRFKWLKTYAGPVVGDASKEVDELVRGTGGSISSFLQYQGLSTRFAGCGAVIVSVPEGSTVHAVKPLAKEPQEADWGDCDKDANGDYICATSYSAWTLKQDGTVVAAVYKNWSHNLSRSARLDVYFTPPQEWAKSHP